MPVVFRTLESIYPSIQQIVPEAYSGPGPVLGPGDTAVNQKAQILSRGTTESISPQDNLGKKVWEDLVAQGNLGKSEQR